jgi:Ras family
MCLRVGRFVESQLHKSSVLTAHAFVQLARSMLVCMRNDLTHWQGAILVYDVTSEASFDSLEVWRKNLEANADPACVGMICGNKVYSSL